MTDRAALTNGRGPFTDTAGLIWFHFYFFKYFLQEATFPLRRRRSFLSFGTAKFAIYKTLMTKTRPLVTRRIHFWSKSTAMKPKISIMSFKCHFSVILTSFGCHLGGNFFPSSKRYRFLSFFSTCVILMSFWCHFYKRLPWKPKSVSLSSALPPIQKLLSKIRQIILVSF